MVNTRPDVAFATSKLVQYILEPIKHYKIAVKHLLRYLRLTRNTYIRYSSKNSELVEYSDADYASDKTDRKSTIKNIFILIEGAISWLSRK
jgi:hypothetical protein